MNTTIAVTELRETTNAHVPIRHQSQQRTPPPSADHIMQTGVGFMASKVLLSAVELGVFTELAAGPLDAATLRQRLGLHPRSGLDFLDALVAAPAK